MHPCKNMSQNPESEFRIDPASQIMLQKELRTVNKKFWEFITHILMVMLVYLIKIDTFLMIKNYYGL